MSALIIAKRVPVLLLWFFKGLGFLLLAGCLKSVRLRVAIV